MESVFMFFCTWRIGVALTDAAEAYRDPWIRTMLPPLPPVLEVSLGHDPWIRTMP